MRILGGIGLGMAVLIGVSVLSIALFAAGLAFRYFTADVRGRVDAQEQILSGPNRIAQYDHFFNLCASVQSLEAQLDALNVELPRAPTVRDESRILASITGVTAARARAINQYNADALKSYTSARFRDSDLPFQIPTGPYEGTPTSCAYEL